MAVSSINYTGNLYSSTYNGSVFTVASGGGGSSSYISDNNNFAVNDSVSWHINGNTESAQYLGYYVVNNKEYPLIKNADGYYLLGQTAAGSYPITKASLAPNGAACYAAGTSIRTHFGSVPVENLSVGDLIVTASGTTRPIRWVGSRLTYCRQALRPCEVMPVRVAAHAFGENRPACDLFVSPGHAICVDVLGEVLIPAGALVNGSTIQQIDVDEVTYWHVELDSHDIILAENLPAESYLDMGDRGFFKESEVVDLVAGPDIDPSQRTHADFCRPFVDSGPVVEAVKAQLAKRAEAAGWALTSDLELHLEIDGVRVDPVVRDLVARFQRMRGKDVWLVSPTTRPGDTMSSPDSRELGVSVTALRIEDGLSTPRDVPMSDPLLCIGFHDLEEGGRRWTAGRARLPAALWEGCETDFYLRVELAGLPVPRWVEPAAALPRLAIVA